METMKRYTNPHMHKAGWRRKELIVFDLDGTLTPSKSRMDREMGILLSKLLGQKRVAVIGGGTYEQFKEQFLPRLGAPRNVLKNLFLFPTTSTSFYRYRRGWRNVYRKELSPADKGKIVAAFKRTLASVGYRNPPRLWGRVIEDRRTQITFSALGQEVCAVLGIGSALRASFVGHYNRETSASNTLSKWPRIG